VGACEWQGRKIADHGEVWFMPWEVDLEAWRHGAILTNVRMPVSPFHLERSIRLENDDIQFDYRLTNLGTNEEVYLWAIHPLFTIQPGDRIELANEVRQVRVFGTQGYEDTHANLMWDWPQPAVGVHLDDLDRFGVGRSAKLFVDRLEEGRAAISNANQRERLSVLWDVRENPALGIWICNGAWNGFYQMALEPTNAGAEFLTEAGERPEAFRAVRAGETIRWQLRMRFDCW
jgi:galactose mutarotase-like enzyme